MRFINRSASGTKEVAAPVTTLDGATATAAPKGGLERLFSKKSKDKNEQGFDLLASLDGEDDDARNDKSSYASKLFRRSSTKDVTSNKASSSSMPSSKNEVPATTASTTLSSLFFKSSAEDEAREGTSSSKKIKEKDAKPSKSAPAVTTSSAHAGMFQFKNRSGDDKKEKSSVGATAAPVAAAAAVGTTAATAAALFQFKGNNSTNVDEKSKDAPKKQLNRRIRPKKKDSESSAKDSAAATTPSIFPFQSNTAAAPAVADDTSPKTKTGSIPMLRKRPSKDKEDLAASATSANSALPSLFQFNGDSAPAEPTTTATKSKARSSPKSSSSSAPTAAAATATTAVTAAGAVAAVAAIPALLSRMSFDKDESGAVGEAVAATKSAKTSASAAAASTTATTTTTTRSHTNSNPAVKAKLFPKPERKQIKATYHNFSANAAHVLQVEQEESPPKIAAPTHVLVKIQASTVTVNDCLLRRGFDFNVLSPASLPLTPGFDMVGNIVEVGPRVPTTAATADAQFAVGDRVAAIVRSGGNARYLSVPYTSLVKVPPHLDSADVAALVSIYATAYQALRKVSGGSPMFSLEGKKILILGGMDGVGQALIQLCKKARATIYATAPQVRHVYLKNVLGVQPLSETDWLSAIEGQLDYVFDGLCEDGTEKSCKALKRNGELVCYGHASMLKEREIGILGAPFSARISQLYSKMSFRVHTVDIWESFCNDPSVYKQDLKTLCQLLKWNKLKPHIAKRVSLVEVAAAQTKLEQGDIRGTIVCFPWRPIRSGKIAEGEDEV